MSTPNNSTEDIKSRARKVLEKQKNEGINLDEFTEEDPHPQKYSTAKELPADVKEAMEGVGVEVTEKSSGMYLQGNNDASLCVSNIKGVELMPITEALKKYDGKDGKLNLQDYMWKAVQPDKDKYTAEAAVHEFVQGYFIYAKKGQRTVFPLQSCLFINIPGMKQVVHNVIIAEEGAQLDIITGCTTHKTVKKAIHLGISEFYAGKNAKISFTMIHNWKDETEVRPRTGIILEEGAKFSNFYIAMSPVKSLQMAPTVQCKGKNSSYFNQTLIYGKQNSKYDTGAKVFLTGENSNAQIISRVIAVDEANVINRGQIIGDGKNVMGHIDCSALLLSPKARVDSIPEIDALNPDVSLTHEASVGKIAQDHIEYLMSRGLTENEARELIVRGFLDADTSALPPALAKETKKLIQMAAESEMS
jgi:Fe-S cluster assembly scaffold protein SufB